MTDTSEQTVAVLTLNPAVDISYEIPQLLEYQKVCATNTACYPGGNGINITRALIELGVPVHCYASLDQQIECGINPVLPVETLF